jgi:plasmid maintenance system antidote protein VapI
MALRLGKAFNTTPELWMNMQRDFDLWYAAQYLKLTKIKVFRKSNSKANKLEFAR